MENPQRQGDEGGAYFVFPDQIDDERLRASGRIIDRALPGDLMVAEEGEDTLIFVIFFPLGSYAVAMRHTVSKADARVIAEQILALCGERKEQSDGSHQ